MTLIADRLSQVRQIMQAQNLSAFVVPRADEYLGEYVPEHNERLRWISNFTGSAGVVIVMRERAAIFVDGRYTVQVRQQVDTELFEIHHLIEQPHLPWLAKQLSAGERVGIDTRVHNLDWYQDAAKTLGKANIELVELTDNPIDQSWHDRPLPVTQPALLLDETYTGRSSLDKRQQLANDLQERGLDAALIFAPDSVAWLLNIRGKDIPSLPVVLGFALLRSDASVTWFTDPAKIPAEFAAHVGTGVSVASEAEAPAVLSDMAGQQVLADPKTANAWTQLALQRGGATLVAGNDPVLIPKACKNEVELAGMQQAHIRDGVAEVKFLCWLDAEVAAGNWHDEGALSDKLFSFRAEQPLFQEVSFDTISAAGSNAAMCHYSHTNGTPAELPENGVYLVDSGGQYLDGTTDITRTVAIGTPSDEIRTQFTLVLKGYIALDCARFPHGTTGTQLDAFARQYLWQQGWDFDHGTGHGVGHFLSVHEGPQGIRKNYNPTPLQPGMVVSNEPGFYKEGEYGIRCENLIFVKEAQNLPGNVPMLEFEALTLAPFDLRLVDEKLLTADEIEWLNDYHQRVYETLADKLTAEEQQWLKIATRAL